MRAATKKSLDRSQAISELCGIAGLDKAKVCDSAVRTGSSYTHVQSEVHVEGRLVQRQHHTRIEARLRQELGAIAVR
jgi:hypothetical protein